MMHRSEKQPRGTSRRGFTILELVVVLIIVGILIALILPAIQSARLASKRPQCLYRLRSIGLAMHNYHTAYGRFPFPGVVSARMVGTHHVDLEGTESWGTTILPFMDHLYVYMQYHSDLPSCHPENAVAVQQVIPLYLCPQTHRDSNMNEFSISREMIVYPNLAAAQGYRTTYAASDYISINGISMEFAKHAYQGREIPDDLTGAMDQLLLIPDASLSEVLGNPSLERKSSLDDITDGAANTILIGENARRNELWRWGKRILETTDQKSVEQQKLAGGGGWADPLNQAWLNGRLYDGTGMSGPCAINCSNEPDAGLSGFHRRSVSVLMADGSTRSLNEELAPHILGSLITKKGGEKPAEF